MARRKSEDIIPINLPPARSTGRRREASVPPPSEDPTSDSTAKILTVAEKEARQARPGLTKQQIDACRMQFEGDKSDQRIAQAVGCAVTSLHRWRALPDYKALLESLRAEATDLLGISTLADAAHRMRLRDQRHKDLQQVRLQRQREAMERGETSEEALSGFYSRKITRQYKGKGDCVETEEWVFDRELFAALSADEQAVERAVSPTTVNLQHSGPNGGPIQHAVEVNVVGYGIGTAVDALAWVVRLKEAGRLPQSPEDAYRIMEEIDARRRDEMRGLPLPPLTEPYQPAPEERRR